MDAIKKGDTISFLVNGKIVDFEVVGYSQYAHIVSLRSLDLELVAEIHEDKFLKQKSILRAIRAKIPENGIECTDPNDELPF